MGAPTCSRPVKAQVREDREPLRLAESRGTPGKTRTRGGSGPGQREGPPLHAASSFSPTICPFHALHEGELSPGPSHVAHTRPPRFRRGRTSQDRPAETGGEPRVPGPHPRGRGFELPSSGRRARSGPTVLALGQRHQPAAASAEHAAAGPERPTE